MCTKKIKDRIDLYYRNRIDYLLLFDKKKPADQYEQLKEYLAGMRATEAMRAKVETKFYNSANHFIIARNALTKERMLHFDAIATRDKEQVRRAIKHYSSALKHDPEFVEAQYNLGLLYVALDNPKAVLHLKNALKYETSFRTLYSLGLVEMKLGNHASAYFLIKEASFFMDEKEKRKGDLWNNLAVCAEYVKDPQFENPAWHYINEAIKFNEKNPFYYITRAEIHKKQGRMDSFEYDLNKAQRELNQIDKKDYLKWIDTFNRHSKEEVKKTVDFLQSKIENLKREALE